MKPPDEMKRVVNRFEAAWIEERFKILAKKAHPDRGGSAAAMAELNIARAAAIAEIKESGGQVW